MEERCISSRASLNCRRILLLFHFPVHSIPPIFDFDPRPLLWATYHLICFPWPHLSLKHTSSRISSLLSSPYLVTLLNHAWDFLFLRETSLIVAGNVPYFRLGLTALFWESSWSMSPKTSSECSPSPSSSFLVKIRAGVLKIRISAMPAQVFRRMVVGCEFMARAVTSEMESQQIEHIPI